MRERGGEERDEGGEDFAVVPINIDMGDPQKPKDFYAETGLTALPFFRDETMGVFNDLKGQGVAFGLPSLRIKGFYLAIATLAAQFFLVWLFQKWGWLYNYSASGAIQVPNISILGFTFAGPTAPAINQYFFVLCTVTLITFVAINLTRGRIGRQWKAVRDMDIAAELVGINLMKAKLLAFFVSSYIIGAAGALFVFLWHGAAEANLFDMNAKYADVVSEAEVLAHLAGLAD